MTSTTVLVQIKLELEPVIGNRSEYARLTSLHWSKKRYDIPVTWFVFFCLFFPNMVFCIKRGIIIIIIFLYLILIRPPYFSRFGSRDRCQNSSQVFFEWEANYRYGIIRICLRQLEGLAVGRRRNRLGMLSFKFLFPKHAGLSKKKKIRLVYATLQGFAMALKSRFCEVEIGGCKLGFWNLNRPHAVSPSSTSAARPPCLNLL